VLLIASAATAASEARLDDAGPPFGMLPLVDQVESADPALLEQYYEWWFGKRREFVIRLRDYRRAKVNRQAVASFNGGFLRYVREFDAAFLSLLTLPSVVDR